MAYDMLADYQNYDPGFQQMQSPAPPAPGMGAALPWVQAGLSGASLLSSLYGSYQAGKIADRNYKLQKQEFERQRAMEEERMRREEEQRSMANAYTAADRAENSQDRLLNRYAGYYRQIGL